MAALALGFLGASLGTAGSFLSIAGGIIGSAVGGLIDQALFGPKMPDGPRLDDLKFQGSSYGGLINRVHGTARTAGTVIWAPPLIEEKSKVGGGKGGASQKVYKYYAHAAIAVAEGECDILTIWADKKIIYDISSDASEDEGTIAKVKNCADVRFYKGTVDQLPDGLITAFEGVEKTPAYKGITMIVIERMALEDYGNRLPTFEFEVSRGAERFTLAVVASCPAPGGVMVPMRGGPFRLDNDRILEARLAIGDDGAVFQAVRYNGGGSAVASVHNAPFVPELDTGTLSLMSAMSPGGTMMAVATPRVIGIFDLDTNTWKQRVSSSGGIFRIDFATDGSLIAWSSSNTQRFDVLSPGITLTNTASTGIATEYDKIVNMGSAAYAFNTFNYTTDEDGGSLELRLRRLTSEGWEPVLAGPTVVWGADTSPSNFSFLGVGNGLVLGYWSSARAGSNDLVCQLYRVSAVGFQASSPVVTIPWSLNEDYSLSDPALVHMGSGRVAAVLRHTGGGGNGFLELTAAEGSLSLSKPPTEVGVADGVDDNAGANILTASTSNGVILAADQVGIRVFSVYTKTKAVPFASILAEEFERVGLLPADYDVDELSDDMVHGFLINGSSAARQVVEPLMTIVPFDLVESSGVIKAVRRKGAVDLEIEEGFYGDGSNPAFEITRIPDADIPRKLTLSYSDIDDDYQVGTQYAQRNAASKDARSEVNLSVSISMSAETALQTAERSLHTQANERLNMKITLPRPYIELEAGDILGWRGIPVRLAKVTAAGTKVEVEGVPVYVPAYSSDALAPDRPPARPPLVLPQPSTLAILELPALRDTDDMPGFYAVITGNSAWPGADLIRSVDGINWEGLQSVGQKGVKGSVIGDVTSGPADMWDERTVITVEMTGTDSLTSVTSEELLASDVNMCLIGDELIQYRLATMVEAGKYELTGLLRGRHGTEQAIDTHVTDEPFYAISPSTLVFQPLDLADSFRDYDYKAVTLGLDLSQSVTVRANPGLSTIMPLAPVHVRGIRNEAGDLSISWLRRSRIRGGWFDRIDVPLDEPAEAYEVEILLSGSVVRRFETTAPAVSYSAAQQITDFGSTMDEIEVNISQTSSRAGPGHPATAII